MLWWCIGFFFGLMIGNFLLEEVDMFLCDVVWLLCGGGLLVGVDFVKDECMLYYVYNDV